MPRYNPAQHQQFIDDFNRDGFVVLKNHYDTQRVEQWARAFKPLLAATLEDPAQTGARGRQRALHQPAQPAPGAEHPDHGGVPLGRVTADPQAPGSSSETLFDA